MPMRDVTAVRINICYNRFKKVERREPNEDEIYQIARWAWPSRYLERNSLVFAHVNGRIIGVYEVDGEWYWCDDARNRPELRPAFPKAPAFRRIREIEIEDDIRRNVRLAFVGHRAACANQFLGTAAPRSRYPVTSIKVNVN